MVSITFGLFPEVAKKAYEIVFSTVRTSHWRFNRTNCINEVDYSVDLSDNVRFYLEESYLKGTRVFPKGGKDIVRLLNEGKLELVEENEYFLLDTMHYSYPFLTPEASDLLDEIGERFHRKLENTNLACSRFVVTSILRTTRSVARLRRWNRNSIKNSSHLHGTSFDISYRSFVSDQELTDMECSFLGDLLTRTVWELRKEGRCFVTYETWQTCLHVVSR